MKIHGTIPCSDLHSRLSFPATGSPDPGLSLGSSQGQPDQKVYATSSYRERKMRTNFFRTNFLNTPYFAGTSRHNSRDIPGSYLPNPRQTEDKLSREGMNFSTTTPSRGRPPPHPVDPSHPTIASLCSFSCLIFFKKLTN